MDLSKLPRLSNTATPASPPADQPAPPETPPQSQPPATRSDSLALGAEIWLALILGLLFMFLGRTFVQYEIGNLTHHPYHTNVTWQQGPKEGTEVPYPELDESFAFPFYSDSGLFFFGFSLVFAGIAQMLAFTRWRIQRPVGWLALLIVLGATAYNLFVVGKLFSAGITPLLSLLCVAFGGFEAFLQFRALGPRSAGTAQSSLQK
jgi:hypothetical protein